MDFEDTLSAIQVESCIDEIDREIKQQYLLVKRIFIEAERARGT